MRFWDMLQAHMDAYGVREAEIARRAGMSPKTLNSWKVRGVPVLPDRERIEALAVVLNRPYDDVLSAILQEVGYTSGAWRVSLDPRAATRRDPGSDPNA